jgi:hypothetical protein
MNNQNFNVQAAPNKSRIRGKVVKIVKDKKLGAKLWQVKVEESYDVNGMPNFTKSRVGDFIKIYTAIDDKSAVKVGEGIEISVTYQADETGGVFFIADNDAQST